MKYIIFKTKFAGCEQEVPIIFPDQLVHLEVAKALTKIVGSSKIVAAGEFSSLDIEAHCYGSSTTIGIKSRNIQDGRLIQTYDYTKGLL